RATAVSDEQPSTPANNGLSGMVWIPGGEFSMGAVMNGSGSSEMPMASNDAGPIHRVFVDGFWMDATTVTNEQFEKLAKAIDYVKIAERTPNGRANVCRPKPSLNSPPAAVWKEKHLSGATNFAPAENGWPTPGRENSR